MVDDILQNLRKDGQLEKEGEFRLDPEKAREKLRDFRLPDPHRWVLEIVSAANLLGATKVEFRVDADEVEATFDGSSFEAEDLSDLFNAAFRRARTSRDLASKQLAIGFTAAEALRPTLFTLESGTTRLTLAPGTPRVEVISKRDTTRIYLRESFRAGHLVEFFKNLSGNIAEKTYLKEFAKYSETAVYLDKSRISFPFNFGGQPAHGILESDGIRGHARILPGEKTTRTHLVQFGVLILTETTKSPLGAEAILDCPTLQRDMSNAAFIKDDAFKAVMGLSKVLYFEGAFNLYKSIPLEEWYQHASLEPLVIHVVEALAEQRLKGEPELPILVKVGRLFEDYSIWPVADRPELGEKVFAKTSLAQVRKSKKLYISTEKHSLESIPGKSPVLLVTKRHILDLTVAEVEEYLQLEVEDVTAELQQAGLVSRNRARWNARPWPTALNVAQCIRTQDSKHGAYLISTGVSHESAPPASACWVKDAKLLHQEPSLFDVIISGPVQENSEFSGPSLNDQNRKLAFDAVNAIHRLFLSISTLKNVEPEPRIRRAGRAYFAALASRSFHGDILTSLGFGEAKSEFWNKYAMSDSPFALGDYRAMGVTLDSIVRALGDFADLRIFERVDGKGSHSFAELVVASEKSQLLVVKETDKDQLFSRFSAIPSTGTFIWTNPEMDRALYAVFREDVKPGLDKIMEFSQANAFQQRNIRPFAIEQASRYDVVRTLEVMNCEIIFAWREPGERTRNQFLFRYFHEARILEEEFLKPLLGEFLVYVRGPVVEPNSEYSGVERSKKRTKLQLELVKLAYSQLVDWLAQQLELKSGSQSSATEEVLSYLILTQPKTLRDLNFLTTSEGDRISPGVVRKWPKPLAFSETERVVSDFVPSDAPAVLLARRSVLESLFPKVELVDCSAKEGLIEAIQRNRQSFTSRPIAKVTPPGNHLAEVTLCGDGLNVHLWMLPDVDPGSMVSHISVDAMFDERVLCGHSLQVPLGRFAGVIHGDSIQPDLKTYDRMAKMPQELDATLLELAQTCFVEWVSGQNRRELLVWYLSRCNAAAKAAWPLAYEAMRQAPIFEFCDGSLKSLNELLERQSLLFWTNSRDVLNGIPASEVLVIQRAVAIINLFPDLPWRHVNAVEARPASVPVRNSETHVPQVRGQAVQLLRDWLMRGGAANAGTVATRVEKLGLRQLGGERLFSYASGELVMDVNHPIGVALSDGDATMLPFAASSLYSFLGASDSVFDCTAELALHRAMVTRLIQSGRV